MKWRDSWGHGLLAWLRMWPQNRVGSLDQDLLAKLLLEEPGSLLLDEPTNYLDAEHDWLKLFAAELWKPFVLISHDIPFLNDVINICHVENQQLTRYSGDYYQFLEVYEMKKSQWKQLMNITKERLLIAQKSFVARNKARVATRNMAMSRPKKRTMELIELQVKQKPSFEFKNAPWTLYLQAKDLRLGMTVVDNLAERNQKVASSG